MKTALCLVQIEEESYVSRWWPLQKKTAKPVRLSPDPAFWKLGKGEEWEQTVELLLCELESPVPSRRERAVELLAEVSSEKVVEALVSLLRQEENLVVRWKAMCGICDRGIEFGVKGLPTVGELEAWKQEILKGLLVEMNSERASERWGAAEGLGQIGDPLALPALVKALWDPHAFVRWTAADAIGQIGTEKAISLLLPLLQEEDPLVRRSAVDALAFFDTPSVRKALHKALHDSDPSVRRNAIDAVARLGDPQVVEALVLSLDAKNDFWVRYSAAEALGVVGDHRAIPPLLEAVQDPQPLLRRVAVHSLGLLRDSRAIPALVRSLEDQDPQVRMYAADGLGRLGHEGVLAHLQNHVEDETRVFGRKVGDVVRQAVAAIEARIAQKTGS
jgi:HEAT repeat protein